MRARLTSGRLLPAAIEVGATAAILAALWAYTAGSTSPYVTPLGEVLKVFRETWLFARFGSDVVPSLERIFVGYGLSVVIGVGLGLAIGSSRPLRLMAQPVMSFLRALPPPALLPFFIVVLGIGSVMKIVVIVFVCVWPILLNTVDGVLGLDPTLIATADSYRIHGLDRIRHVLLPAVGPRAFAGMRTSLAIAVLILVVSEMIASSNGIGYFVLQAEQSFSVPQMWAGTLLLGLLGYGLNAGFTVIERHTLRWYFEQRARGG